MLSPVQKNPCCSVNPLPQLLAQLYGHGESLQQRSPSAHKNPVTVVAPPMQSDRHSCIETDSQLGAGVELTDGEAVVDMLALTDAEEVAEALGLFETVGVTDMLIDDEADGVVVGVGLALGFGQQYSPAFAHLNEFLDSGERPPGHSVVTAHVCPLTDVHSGGLQHFWSPVQKNPCCSAEPPSQVPAQLYAHGESLQQPSCIGHKKPVTLVAPPTQSCLQICIGTDSQSGGGEALPDGEAVEEELGLLEVLGVMLTLGLLEADGVAEIDELLDAVGLVEILGLLDTDGVADTLTLLEADGVADGEGLSLGFGQHRSPAFGHLNDLDDKGARLPGQVFVVAHICPLTEVHSGGLQHFLPSLQKNPI